MNTMDAVVNAANAAGRVVRAVITRAPVRVTEEVKAERLRECVQRSGQCFDAESGRCRVCLCFVKLKAGLATERCPKNFWPEIR